MMPTLPAHREEKKKDGEKKRRTACRFTEEDPEERVREGGKGKKLTDFDVTTQREKEKKEFLSNHRQLSRTAHRPGKPGHLKPKREKKGGGKTKPKSLLKEKAAHIVKQPDRGKTGDARIEMPARKKKGNRNQPPPSAPANNQRNEARSPVPMGGSF